MPSGTNRGVVLVVVVVSPVDPSSYARHVRPPSRIMPSRSSDIDFHFHLTLGNTADMSPALSHDKTHDGDNKAFINVFTPDRRFQGNANERRTKRRYTA